MYEYNINKPLPNNIISVLSVIISVFTLAVSIVKEFKASVFIGTIVISIIALILILFVFALAYLIQLKAIKIQSSICRIWIKKSIIDNLLNEIEKNETPKN